MVKVLGPGRRAGGTPEVRLRCHQREVTYHRKSSSIANLLIRDAYIIANHREMGMCSVDPSSSQNDARTRARVVQVRQPFWFLRPISLFMIKTSSQSIRRRSVAVMFYLASVMSSCTDYISVSVGTIPFMIFKKQNTV